MKRPFVSRLRSSRLMRLVTVSLIAGHCVSAAPLVAQEAATGAVRAGHRATADVQRAMDAARVRPNRTVPAVTPPNLEPMFGMNVTTDVLRRARVFPELLIPNGPPTTADNLALARTLERVATVPAARRMAAIDDYLRDHPLSAWRPSLLTNAATLYAREGYFSRAEAYWRQAWELTRHSDEPSVRTLADMALGESLQQMVKFGQVDALEARLKEADGRDVRGASANRVADAREGLLMLREKHETATFSGPEALKMYLTVRPVPGLEHAVRTIGAYHPRAEGTSILELKDLAAGVGLALQVWKASAVDAFPVPSVVHLRSQHFSAIVEHRDGKYRLRDPGLGGDLWLSDEALRDESTGFVLAPSRPAGNEWQLAEAQEAAGIVGHCTPGHPSTDDYPPDYPQCGGGGNPGSPSSAPPSVLAEPPDPSGPGCNGGSGMPYYRFHPTSVALLIDDAPVGYTPPVGLGVAFRLSYNHRSSKHPNTYGYGNVGEQWTFNHLSYVIDNNTMLTPPYSTTVAYLRGHGREVYSSFDPVHPVSGATLVEVTHDPVRYERRLQNGTTEAFTLADRAASLSGRRIFLTEVIDPQGHSLSYTYDSNFRVVAVSDALGQVTTFAYEHATNPDLLTTVTDPFARTAVLGYDSVGRLNSITDAVGMTSTFVYGTGDFITAMTTPYGTTTFRPGPTATDRTLEATDPAGGRERLVFHLVGSSLPATDSSGNVPTGFSASNDHLDYWNSFYWDKAAMATAPTDYAAAVQYNWMQANDVSYGHAQSRPVLHSLKRPLERRVWYRYPGQGTSHHSLGTGGAKPSLMGQVVDGGASQVTALTYNTKGRVTSRVDPLGRQTNLTYASNGLDLLTVEQVRSGGTDVLQTFDDYTSRRLPATIVDAAGQTTTLTYNTFGQPLTVTNALSQTTTYTYEAVTQNLLSVTGPVSGATTTYTYDGYGRIATVTDAEGYTVTLAHDALNRLTQVTYPDATTETWTYSRLDLTQQKDRLGRITRHFYDGYGRRTATQDPAGRTVSVVWCACGRVDALVDAKGQRTRWEYDAANRVTREVRADNTTDTTYAYDGTGRLATVTDPLDQVTTYTYNLDGSLASTGFTNETIGTADLSHTYDTYYPRPLTMVDGNGTTTYTYKAAGTLGAGQLASVDGPLTNDTVTYTYDALGRVATRLLNGTGTELTYDALGRIEQLEFPIGSFDYTFAGHSARVASVTYPNAQTSTYSYLDDEGDFRLQTIHHKNPSAATLSKFDYTYDTVGNILTWRQERAGAVAKVYTFAHDAVDQLTSAVLTDTNTTPAILARQAWAYDPAGNRTVDQNDDAVFATTHDNMNRLQARAPGGPIVLSGTVNEAATVTIDGQPATVDASNTFRGTAQVTSGTTTVTVKAKDPTGNETTQQYEIDAAGSTTSYTYDANGNLTSDGTKTYFWNALNQLVEVKTGSTTVATFEYDGAGRRTEKAASGLTHNYVYDSEDIVEERLSGSTTDTIRYYHGAGIDEPLARKDSAELVTYYLADHLGSIVQETEADGDVELEREYDPWGLPLQGSSVSGFSFTGREWDSGIALYYYRARYYDASMGRFLSQDPAGLIDGPNLSKYVQNRPTGALDPTGNNTWLLQWVPAVISTVATTVTVGTFPAWVGPAVVAGGLIATTIAVERLTRPYRTGRHTPDQEALVDLAKEAKNKGDVSEKEAKILVDWGKEVGFPGSRGPEVHEGRPFGGKPHIHVGPVNHIPVCAK